LQLYAHLRRPHMIRPRTMFGPSLILLLFALEVAADDCYWRNGGRQLDLNYQQCRSSTTCCAVRDDCLDNGLCRLKANHSFYWRESCTQSDWDAGGCQDICSTNVRLLTGLHTARGLLTMQGDDSKTDVRVTPCDGTANSTTWCCGDTNICCNDPDSRVTVAPVFVGSAAASSTSLSSSTTSASQSTPQTTSSSSPSAIPSPTFISTSSNTSNNSLSTGAKAGIGVGAALGVIALIAVGWFIGRRTHTRKQVDNPYVPETVQVPSKYEHRAAPPGELVGDQLHELPGHRGVTIELGTN
jgi:hypothetical protein